MEEASIIIDFLEGNLNNYLVMNGYKGEIIEILTNYEYNEKNIKIELEKTEFEFNMDKIQIYIFDGEMRILDEKNCLIFEEF
ncbi:MAG: hypothetical protein RR942_06400 [Romboutsia sp.]